MTDPDELEPLKTLHDYINELLVLSGDLMAHFKGTADYEYIDDMTGRMDELLIEMRHADWRHEIG